MIEFVIAVIQGVVMGLIGYYILYMIIQIKKARKEPMALSAEDLEKDK